MTPPDLQALAARLTRTVDSGRRTVGGGSIGPKGSTMWGGEPIMVLANPDGPDALERITALEQERAELREALEDQREPLARLLLSDLFGFEYDGDSLCDEADRIFSQPHPRAARAVNLADRVITQISTALAATSVEGVS